VATERLVGTRDGRKYKTARRVIGTGKREEILQIGLLGGQLHSGFLRLHMGMKDSTGQCGTYHHVALRGRVGAGLRSSSRDHSHTYLGSEP